ncbi:MAG: PAS domain S-box protein, partial [Candidatus Eisenbacteria bacterium]
MIVLGLGVFLARPDRGIVALLSMRSAAGVMARRLLPAGVAVPVLLGWLVRAGEQTELYPRGFGLSLLVVANVLVLSALISIVARRLERLEEERGRAFESLRCAEARYRGVLEASPDAVVCATAGGEISVVNAQAERLFRYDRAELLGKPIETLIPERMRDHHRPLREGYCLAPTTRRMGNGQNLMARRSDGTEFPAEISLSPLETAEGLTVVSTVRDVTERQQIEERLRQSEKMEAVGRLASGVAHDFNNLLSVVIGYGDMLLRGLPDGDRRRGTVEQILQAGYRAATLTQQLLAYGRRQVSQPRVLDLNSIVLDMGKMLRRMIGEQIELDTDLDPKLGRVRMDQAQMEQVFMNLVINARDAMPDGGKLLIETRNARLGDADVGGRDSISPGLYVMVAVTDTGVGMDAATQARIFEPF